MDTIGTIDSNVLGQTRTSPPSSAVSGLAGEDFLKLLITQLTNQDPLEPTGNEELLSQIASLREIELSTTLTATLQTLTGQQHVASASAMIGRFVSGPVSSDGLQIEGVVVGARFETDGNAVLMLSGGQELPLDQVTAIQSSDVVGEALIGKMVSGIDRRDPGDPRSIEGVVDEVRTDEQGGLLLELQSGEALRLSDVTQIGDAVDGSSDTANAIAKTVTKILGIG